MHRQVSNSSGETFYSLLNKKKSHRFLDGISFRYHAIPWMAEKEGFEDTVSVFWLHNVYFSSYFAPFFSF